MNTLCYTNDNRSEVKNNLNCKPSNGTHKPLFLLPNLGQLFHLVLKFGISLLEMNGPGKLGLDLWIILHRKPT